MTRRISRFAVLLILGLLVSCGGGGGGTIFPVYPFNAALSGSSVLTNWSHNFNDPSACWGYFKSTATQQITGTYFFGSNGNPGPEQILIGGPAVLAVGAYANTAASFGVPDTNFTGPLHGSLNIYAMAGNQVNYTYSGTATSGVSSNYSGQVSLSTAVKDSSRCPDVFQ